MTARRCAASLLVAFLLLGSEAWAAQYPGWGDTGWVYAGKRDCCDGAITIAQENSAIACRTVGGVPRTMRGGVQRRGFCNWQSARDEEGVTIFRCTAEATIRCQ